MLIPMKLVALLSRLAALGVASCLAAIALNAAVLGWFAFSACTLVLLIATADYAPRRSLAVRHTGTVVDFPTAPAQMRRLAA